MREQLWRFANLRATAACAAITLAGCAAIQVDVDVYKGPLANEQEIQLRQFASLAIAAKPLLASFRNDIEEQERRGREQPFSDYLAAHPGYADNHISDREVRFSSELARFVNGSMLYYGDLAPPAVDRLIKAISRSESALGVFAYNSEDKLIAESLRPDESAAGKLAAAYQELLCGQENSCPSVPTGAYRTNVGRVLVHFAVRCAAVESSHIPKRLGLVWRCPTTERSNDVYEHLAKESEVRAHSIVLFGEKGDERFVRRVTAIGRAFHDSRIAMRDLFEGALAVLDEPQSGTDRVRSVRVEDAASIVTRSMQPRFLACMLSAQVASVHLRWTRLPQEVSDSLDMYGVFTGKNGPKWNFDLANASVRSTATRFPHETAAFLRDMHRMAPELDEAVLINCKALDPTNDGVHVVPKVARTYGLAAGPGSEGDFGPTFAEIKKSVASIARETAVSFDRARLNDGIESLTADFLEQLDRHNHDLDNQEVRRARQRLEESLIFFAERMLFVVNNITPSTIKQDLAGSGAQRFDSGSGGYADSTLTTETTGRLANRMAVLQSLGNTLVLHANDLTRRLKHTREQEARRAGELEAARKAASPGAPAVFDALLLQAGTELAKRTEQAEKATGKAAGAQQALARANDVLTAAETRASTANQALSTKKSDYLPLEMTVRTLVPLNARKGLFQKGDAGERQAEEIDQRDLTKRIKAGLGDDGTLTATEYVASVNEWLLSATGGDSTKSRRVERLAAARQYLASHKLDYEAVKPAKFDEVQAAIRDMLLRWAQDTDSELRDLEAEAKKADDGLKAAKARQERGSTVAARKDAAATRDGKNKTQAESILAALKGLRGDVIADAEAAGAKDALTVFALLRRRLAEKQAEATKAGASKADELTALTASTAFLADFQPPPSLGVGLSEGWKGKSAVDVYDQVIAQLRQERIQAESAGMKARSENLVRALNAAYEARANVAFLRPASDYLKNVYSSTNLQEASDPGQVDLLNAWWKRLLPKENDFDKYTLEAKQQVEKLYWQNINRVTLSGGGKTNYVLAKDDVGNWYVKSYSADPESIIKAAQGVALYGVGRKIDTNLLRRLNLERKLDAEKDPGERDKLRADIKENARDSNLTLTKVRDRYAAQYLLSITATVQSLRQAADSLQDEADKAVAADVTTSSVPVEKLNARLRASRTELDAALAAMKAALDAASSDKDSLDKIEQSVFSTMDAFRRYRQTTYNQLIKDEDISTELQKRTSVAATVQKLIRDKLVGIVATHKAAIASYENALVNIGDIASAQ